jgi:hypothetical protein
LFSIITADEEFIFSSQDKRSWIQILSSTMKKLHSPPILNDLLGLSRNFTTQLFVEEGEQKEVLADPEWDDYLTKRVLMKKILKWSDSKNPEQVMREIKKMAKRIEKMEQGDLSE